VSSSREECHAHGMASSCLFGSRVCDRGGLEHAGVRRREEAEFARCECRLFSLVGINPSNSGIPQAQRYRGMCTGLKGGSVPFSSMSIVQNS
jgi:hypothetical protein